jgi:serine/threonine protein phosphatase 1
MAWMPLTSPWLAAGPALQVARGLVFALVLWPFRRVFLEGRAGCLKFWGRTTGCPAALHLIIAGVVGVLCMARRTLVIGDIHGCLRQFDALLEATGLTPDDHLILLGDFVDRGPESAGVIKRILRLLQDHQVTAIMGNHEQMMLAARTSHERFSDWLQNGGDATLRSYAGMRATLRDVSADHWVFLEDKLVDYLETDSQIFVHANAYPGLPMAEQPDYMLRWERCDNIAAHESGKTIICGHTPQASGDPMNVGYAICLDTNACRGGPLTCLDVVSGRTWQAEAGGRVRRAHISDFGDG